MEKLCKVFEPYFKIGAAVSSVTVKTHAELLKQHFNLVVCENEMKLGELVDDNGVYDFSKADSIYNFARENGMEVHGHNFVWHWQSRDFLFLGSREDTLQKLGEHMKKVAERYPDITTFDVLNEAIDDKHGLYLRETKWLEKLGEEYIRDVFALARKINPKWKLIYNDYNEYVPEKQDKIIKLVSALKSEGLIDGIGMQAHLNIESPTADEVKRCFERYAALDLPMRVSELDVSLFGFDDHSTDITAERISRQEALYIEYFRTCMEYKQLVDSVTFWGVSDETSWLNGFPVKKRENRPLLFDKNQQPKEIFYKLCELA